MPSTAEAVAQASVKIPKLKKPKMKERRRSMLSGKRPDPDLRIKDIPLLWVYRVVHAGKASARLMPALLCYADCDYSAPFEASHKHLAGWGVDISTVRQGLRQLKKANLITVDSGIGKKTSRITLRLSEAG